MKLDPTRLAHTLAMVTAAFYLVCVLLISRAPGVYFPMMRSWIHGIDFPQSMMRQALPFGVWIYGLITMTGVAWVTGYAFGAIYNAFGEKKK